MCFAGIDCLRWRVFLNNGISTAIGLVQINGRCVLGNVRTVNPEGLYILTTQPGIQLRHIFLDANALALVKENGAL